MGGSGTRYVERPLGHSLNEGDRRPAMGPKWDLDGRQECRTSHLLAVGPRPSGPPISGVCRALPLLAYPRFMPRAGFEPATRGLKDRWSSPEDAHPGGCGSVARLMAAHPRVAADDSPPFGNGNPAAPRANLRPICDLKRPRGTKSPCKRWVARPDRSAGHPVFHAALRAVLPRQRCALRRQRSQYRACWNGTLACAGSLLPLSVISWPVRIQSGNSL